MRDYKALNNLTGKTYYISDVPTDGINALIAHCRARNKNDVDADGVRTEDYLERLEIELVIRSIEGRL